MLSNARILFLAPHTDDVELGAGATLARCISDAQAIRVFAFSSARESLPENAEPDQLRHEFYRAMRHYSLQSSDLAVFDYQVRRLNYFRQEILEELVRINKSFSPDIVFVPSSKDVHQDHEVVYNEAVRAFKKVTILGYELPWNHFTFPVDTLIRVNERQLQCKLNALQEYTSQTSKGRAYFQEDFIRGLARVRGTQIGSSYAEAFEAIRIVY